jgi:hypothetical protein
LDFRFWIFDFGRLRGDYTVKNLLLIFPIIQGIAGLPDQAAARGPVVLEGKDQVLEGGLGHFGFPILDFRLEMMAGERLYRERK